MPNLDINLAGEKTQEDIFLARLRQKSRKVATIILTLFIIACLTVLTAFFVLNKKLRQNEAKIATLKNEIKKYNKIESYLVTIDNRVKAVTSLLEKRISYENAIANLKLILTPGFVPQSLEISRDGSLKINGEIIDNQSLSNFNEIVETITKEGKYSKSLYPLVSRKQDGRYDLYLELKK